MKPSPIFLLNTPIKKLYELGILKTRVYLNLRAKKFQTLNELLITIREDQTNENRIKKLEIFGQRSINELNDLFSKIKIELPKSW